MTSQEIQEKRFDKGMGGYKADDVNAYLAEVASYVLELQDEKAELEKKLMVLAEKLEEYREDEDSLRAALIGAQKLGDSVVRDAKRNAEAILAEANAKARDLVADARSSLDREAISFTKMQSEISNFRGQVLEMYKRQIELIEKGNFETRTPLTVMKAMQSMPAPPPAPAQAAQAVHAPPVPSPSEPLTEPADPAAKAERFPISYEEMDEPAAADAPIPGRSHKRANYGDLRFGEEYNLTRKD